MITEIDFFSRPVRINCRFTPKAEEILNKYHKYYKISTRRLFEVIFSNATILEATKCKLNNINDLNNENSMRKTIAISKGISNQLCRIAKRIGVKRDLAVNILLEVFADWASKQEYEKKQRVIAMKGIINKSNADIDNIFSKTSAEIKMLLPQDDIFLDKFENIRMAFNKAFSGFWGTYFSEASLI